MIQSLFIFRTFISSFFLPKTSKQVFHCRTQDAEFTGNSKVVDREIREIMISNSLEVQSFTSVSRMKSTFINITGARYQKSHQGE